MHKRGQFYLLAAIIIIAVIIGFASVSNFAKKRGAPVKVYDLGKELGIEGGEVLDYGTYSGIDKKDEFTGIYNKYAGEGKKIYFIIGTSTTNVKAYSYEEISGGMSTVIGGGTSQVSGGGASQIPLNPAKTEGDTVTFEIDGTEYPFELKPGENFYFIIQQTIGDEKYSVTG